jgi:hypothetical protein
MLFALTREGGATADAVEALLATAGDQAEDYLRRRTSQ